MDKQGGTPMASFIKNILGMSDEPDRDEGEIVLEDIEDLTEEEREEDLTLEGEPTEPGEETEMMEEEPTEPSAGGETEEAVGEAVNSQELEEIQDEIDDLSSQVSEVRSQNEKAQGKIDEFEEKMQKLYMIYEVIFKGVNPFEEEYDFRDDVHDVLDEFVTGEEGEAMAPGGEGVEEDRVQELEEKIEELEDKLESGEFIEEPEEDIEEEYEETFESVEEEPEEELEEEPEHKAEWNVGDRVMGPNGEELVLTEKQWDAFKGKWQYKAKPAGG